MSEEPVIFGAPWWDEEIVRSVDECIRSGWWQTGPRVADLERRISAMTGAPHVAAVGTASAGLHLALLTLGVGQGDQVVTTPITWPTTASAVLHVGAMPLFADVDPKTANIDPLSVAERITLSTKAVLIVHMAGRPCNMDALLGLCRAKGILLIEDATHALGGSWDKKPLGTLGDAGVFGFNRGKNIAAAEGGVVVCRDAAMAARIRELSNGGVTRGALDRFTNGGGYDVLEAGFNCKMPDLMAAMVLPQLDRFEELQSARRRVWEAYDAAFLDTGIGRPPKAGPDHALHLYQIRTPAGVDRDALAAALKERRIGTGVHYRPLHLTTLYQKLLGSREGDLPGAEEFGSRTLSLPLSPRVTEDDALRVVQAVKESVANGAVRR